jgi:hypothetical protein
LSARDYEEVTDWGIGWTNAPSFLSAVTIRWRFFGCGLLRPARKSMIALLDMPVSSTTADIRWAI